MPTVCGVKFRGRGKVYYFSPGDLKDLQKNDYVVVETSRGRELAQVVLAFRQVDESKIVGTLKPILHRATTADLLEAQRSRQREAEAMERCREEVARFDLPMKIVDAECKLDGTRLTFLFTSEQRVDFRELVRELARIFRTRIELRQIGARDEAGLMGGLGKCGRQLCCATWLTEFSPVSIRMAKQQDLPLSPMEISGLCGRLLCCLRYENAHYQQVKRTFPKPGKTIDTPYGRGKIIKVCVLRETISVLLEDGSTLDLTASELAGESESDSRYRGLGEAQSHALDTSLAPSDRNTSGRGATGQKTQQSDGRAADKRGRLRGRQKPTGGSSVQPRRPTSKRGDRGESAKRDRGRPGRSGSSSAHVEGNDGGRGTSGARASSKRRRSSRRGRRTRNR